MFELIVERSFAAAHRLCDYDGPCARMHGHNYRVECSLVGEELAANGMLMDFGEIKTLCDGILDALDHQCLNELAPFIERNPTSENLARYLFEEMETALTGRPVHMGYVRVWETAGQSAVYRRG